MEKGVQTLLRTLIEAQFSRCRGHKSGAHTTELDIQVEDGSLQEICHEKKTSAKSRILEAVHETASDLHHLGFIDQRKMRKYDALCLDPIPEYDSKKIRALRDRYQLSQTVLASLLNTSSSAVRQWEMGDKHPSGPSRKLLHLLERKGLEALI